jgi:hypothetical protein
MIHLGLFQIRCVVSGDRYASNSFAVPRAKQSLLKFHQTRTNRLRASQNAAALLSDFGRVDIR